MKAAVIEAKNTVRVKDVPFPESRKGRILVRVAYGGFCGPTEMCIIEGIHPRAQFPLVFCHEFSGVVADAPPGSRFRQGDRVAVNPLISCGECPTCRQGNRHVCENLKLIGIDCDGGFAEYCSVPEENALRLPDGLPLRLAAIIEPVAVGVHAVRGSGVCVGDSALVFGAGPIGLILAEVSRIAGAGEIAVCEIDARRAEFARSLGFETVRDAGELAAAGRRFDCALDSSGAEAVLPRAVELVKVRGSISIVGKFDYPAKVNLHDVLFKELSIRGFRVYTQDEFRFTANMLASDPERFGRLVTDEFPLEDAAGAVDAFRQRRNLCKIVVRMPGADDAREP